MIVRRAAAVRGMPEEHRPTAPLVARDERGLREIAGAVHDLWFLLPDIAYDAAAGRVTIPMTHEEKRRGWFGIAYWTGGEVPAGVLTFDAVQSFRVIDEAQIDTYNVSSLVVDSLAGGGVRITLYGGIPIELHVIADRIVARFDPAPPP
ncbi:MAG TPA: hypothetical protein VFT50_05200 [Baekduia sp.]|nr:hypothetical protein [Baekduia sp.]